MKQEEEVGDSIATAEESALIDQFAAFAKAYFIYPSNNSRVQDSLYLFLDSFTEYCEKGEVLAISVRRGKMRSTSGRLDLRKPVLGWLAECLMSTTVAFLRFEYGVTPEGLSKFMKRLQENCARRERDKRGDFTFDELWPEQYTGIELREPQFKGEYGDDPDEFDIDEDARALREAFENTSEGADLDSLIELSDSVLQRVKRVSGLLKSKGSKNAPGVTINLLKEVVSNLPADTIGDREEATKAVEKVLEKVEPAIAGLVMRSESMEDQQLSHLLSTVIQSFFNSPSEGIKPIKPPPMVGGGHAGDELITDDLDLFLEELESIPKTEITIDEHDPFSNSEVIGACLHRLSNCPRDQNAKTIYEMLSRLFDTANEESWRVVRSYADLLLGAESESAARKQAENIFEHLRRGELLGRVREHSCFDVDSLVFAFPNGFMLFLDSLDERQETDRKQLEEYCFRVGDERIRRDEPSFMAESGILRSDRAAKILSCTSRDVLPLVRIIARYGDRALRPRLVTYLLALGIDRPEVAAIGIIEPADRIPQGYLYDVCDGELNNGNFKSNLKQYTGFLIRTYLESLPNGGDCVEARIGAILGLKDFPGADTDALLTDQARGKGPLGLIRPPKAVRDAVNEVQLHLSQGD